ncbi:MAG: hypothetical protein M3Y72_18850 [Acidobacteriota bacterium]|nr:hypothetical protein [Acidobacteriota bacterium]
MRAGKRAVVYVARPIYRKFIERSLWSFLAKIKVFFMAETSERLSLLENRVVELTNLLQTNEQRFRNMEASGTAQWDAMEQLLLAMFRQRESRIYDADRESSTLQQAAILNTTDVNRVNEPNTVR